MNRYVRLRTRRAWLGALMVGALAVAGAAGLPACQQGRQGDRCNPALTQTSASGSPNGGAYNESECNSGLTCTVPPTCVIAVCCPAKPPYADPNCACLANPGAFCACTVQELDGAPWGSDDAGTVDAAGVDGGAQDAGSIESGPGPDATALFDAAGDAQTDAAR